MKALLKGLILESIWEYANSLSISCCTCYMYVSFLFFFKVTFLKLIYA
jgi:hypothetical protein